MFRHVSNACVMHGNQAPLGASRKRARNIKQSRKFGASGNREKLDRWYFFLDSVNDCFDTCDFCLSYFFRGASDLCLNDEKIFLYFSKNVGGGKCFLSNFY